MSTEEKPQEEVVEPTSEPSDANPAPTSEPSGVNPADQESQAEPLFEEEEEEEEPDDGVPIVLVTGASGYIASGLTKALLQDGRFRIRGTVRNKKKKEKIQPLLDLVPDAKYPLRLVEADLQKPETWANAVKSCSYVFHLASPFVIGRQLTDEELVRPAVDGTLNVLKACAEAGTVKRVVLTSSVAAISCGMSGLPGKPKDYVYSESDWSDEAACGGYEKSKLLAERAAWDYVKTLEEDKKFELVVLNPGYVQGPLLSAASGEGTKMMCVGLLTGKFPVTLDINFAVVDVRDVVAAHIAALEKSEAAGNRYALVTGNVALKEAARILTEEFKPQGYNKIPSLSVPKFVAWVGKLFDPTVKDIYPMIGKVVLYNNEKMTRELGITPRPIRDTLIDTCYSLIELGVVAKTSRYLGPPSNRPPPPTKEPVVETPSSAEPTQETADPVVTAEESSSQPQETTPSPDKPAQETTTPDEPAKPQETPPATPEPAEPQEMTGEPPETEPQATTTTEGEPAEPNESTD